MPWFSKEFRLKQFPLESLRKYFNMLVKNNLTYFEENKPPSVICINQAILKLWQVMVTKSDKVKTHLRHLACTYFVTPPFWGHWSQSLTPPPRFELGGSWKISWSEEGDKVIMLKKSPPSLETIGVPEFRGTVYNPPHSK